MSARRGRVDRGGRHTGTTRGTVRNGGDGGGPRPASGYGSGGSSRSSPTPATGSTGIVDGLRQGRRLAGVHPGAARGDVRRCRPSGTPSSPARSASAWPRPAPARSTCSTASTTRSSTTSPSSPSSGRPNAARWAAPTSRRSTCRRCSRTWRASTSSRSTCPSSCRWRSTARSGRPCRAAPDGGHHPERPAGRAVQPAEARVQAGPVQPAAAARAHRRRRPRRDSPAPQRC